MTGEKPLSTPMGQGGPGTPPLLWILSKATERMMRLRGVNPDKSQAPQISEQFKADIVQLVVSVGKTHAEVSKQFDLTETSLLAWAKRAQAIG